MKDSIPTYRNYLQELLLRPPIPTEATHSNSGTLGYAGYMNRPVYDTRAETMNRILSLSSYNALIGNQPVQQSAINPFMFHAGGRIPFLHVRELTDRNLSRTSSNPTNSILEGTHPAYFHGRSSHHLSSLIQAKHSTNDAEAVLTDSSHTSRSGMKDHQNNRQSRTIDWEDRLQMLIDFKKEHGHCRVPQNHPRLGAWVKKQREKYALFEDGKTSCFTSEKIERLNKIGFVWRVRRKRKKNECNTSAESISHGEKTEIKQEPFSKKLRKT